MVVELDTDVVPTTASPNVTLMVLKVFEPLLLIKPATPTITRSDARFPGDPLGVQLVVLSQLELCTVKRVHKTATMISESHK
jgi:hypothetical protein